jgi:hypothetical protein
MASEFDDFMEWGSNGEIMIRQFKFYDSEKAGQITT